ncbi:MAG: hypothetical protein KDC42_07315 [Ignavibacteriae bacterium]|nr:hypothetical protein [Ignavibacteriota bacterium]
MNLDLREQLDEITANCITSRQNREEVTEKYSAQDDSGSTKFSQMIMEVIIPTVKDASWIISRAGCSLNYYTNKGDRIDDPELRTVIQILFYPKGHSRKTLGVNVPFLQFAYSPSKRNVKVTTKYSIKTDEQRFKLDLIDIDDFNEEIFNRYLLSFLREVMQ